MLSTGCKRNQKLPDISNIKVNTQITRLDNDLFAIDPASIVDSVPVLLKKYGEMFYIYSYQVIKIGDPKNPEFANNLKLFVTDYNMNKVYAQVNSEFANLQWLENDLNIAFRYYKYYFPNKAIPKLVTLISGFNQSIVTSDTLMGISLDKYLGANCEFYKAMALPAFMRAGMTKERLPIDCMRAWLLTEFEKSDSTNTLLSHLLYQGKLLYCLKQFMPNKPDTLIMGYTQQQWQWCQANEKQMWTFLVENKTIFKTDYLTINKFTGDAPFTKDFTNQSPGKAAVWLGYNIIFHYMRHNPNISTPILINNTNYQEILRKSKYRP